MLHRLGTSSIDGASYTVDAAGEPDGKDYQATGMTQSCARKQVARKKIPTFLPPASDPSMRTTVRIVATHTIYIHPRSDFSSCPGEQIPPFSCGAYRLR
jgi:hypothetical protein